MNARVHEFLSRASAEPVNVPIRDLLAIWGFKARTFEYVETIRRDLAAAGLGCEPDLREGDLDAVVRVGIQLLVQEPVPVPEEADEDEQLQLPGFAPRIESIPSATAEVTSVQSGATLGYAQSIMIELDYSQLPVMAGERDLKGFVSWRTIAQAALSGAATDLLSVMNPYPRVVHVGDQLLDVVNVIYDAGFVFVRCDDDRICGIVTTADLSTQFRDLTTPFFQIGEIEGRLRICIDNAFSTDDLRQAAKNRKLNSAGDMMFGQYVELLKDEVRWKRMHWGIDQATFLKCLDDTRIIRNRIMHFGEELDEADKARLKHCLNYVRAMLPQH